MIDNIRYLAHVSEVTDIDTYKLGLALGFGVTIKKVVRLAGIDTEWMRQLKKEEHDKLITIVRNILEGKRVEAEVFMKGSFYFCRLQMDSKDVLDTLAVAGIQKYKKA